MPAGDTTRPPPSPIIASARRLLLAGAFLLLVPRLLPAQSDPPQAPPLRVDVRLMNVDVAVMDAAGAPLALRVPKGKRIDYRVFARPGYFAPSQ